MSGFMPIWQSANEMMRISWALAGIAVCSAGVVPCGCGSPTSAEPAAAVPDEPDSSLSDRASRPGGELLVASADDDFAQSDSEPAPRSDQAVEEGKMGIRVRMPGKSHTGPLPELTDQQISLRDQLRRDLEILAGQIGDRNLCRPRAYQMAADWLATSLAKSGYDVQRQTYKVQGQPCANLFVEIAGDNRREEIVVVGAHYDSVAGTVGANDNGTGSVAVLALARRFAKSKPSRTLRFVLFANEEPPYFQTGDMGSLVYARRCKANKENVVAMLSLETIGYYSDAKNSQNYPPPFSLFYPSTGNFIGFVGNTKSAELVTKCVGSFRQHAQFPSEGAAAPGQIQGVGWSDHWSFWQAGYPALMVTDTAPFRYPHYHQRSDTPDKVDYGKMARVVDGLQGVIADLTDPD